MAQIYTTGPVGIWAGVGSGGSARFLGHGMRGARIRVRRFFQPVHTDLSGPQMPHDKSYLGESHTISVQLTRWNEATLQIIQDVPGARSNAPTRGSMFPGDIGTLMVTEAAAYPLWLQFPYSNLPAFQNATNGAMPAGMHYYFAHLTDDDLETGVTARTVSLTFDTIPSFDATSTSNNIQGGFLLYDHTMPNGLTFN